MVVRRGFQVFWRIKNLSKKTEEQSLELNQEARDVLELKSMKGSLAGLTRFIWDELEEMTEKFIKEGRR